MITRAELLALAREYHLTGYHIEKEYLQAHFLHALHSETEDFIFKGGTALRHLFGLPRFSEDIDLNAPLTPPAIQVVLEGCLPPLRRLGLAPRLLHPERFPASFVCRLRFEGPLFVGNLTSTNTLTIEVRARGTCRKPVWREWGTPFPDLSVLKLRTMHPTEILAEKIRALAQRSEPRDLFDVWFLLHHDIALNEGLLNAKPGHAPSELNLPAATHTMQTLSLLIPSPELPTYDEIAALLTKRLPCTINSQRGG